MMTSFNPPLIYNHRSYINECDPNKLKEFFNEVLSGSGHCILNFMEHRFTPSGYTALWLLAESHLAIHSFPEHGLSYVEVSSCSQKKLDSIVEEITVCYRANVLEP